jgi:hypothetical protein
MLRGQRSFPGKKGFLPSQQLPVRYWAHPASYPTGTGGDLLLVKQPRREADSLTASSATVKNGRAIPLLLQLHDTFLNEISRNLPYLDS